MINLLRIFNHSFLPCRDEMGGFDNDSFGMIAIFSKIELKASIDWIYLHLPAFF